MESINLTQIIAIGVHLAFLDRSTEESLLKAQKNSGSTGLYDAIRVIDDGIEKLDFRVTRSAMLNAGFLQLKKDIELEIEDQENQENQEEIITNSELANRIKRLSEKIWYVLNAEGAISNVYLLTEQRYKLGNLLEDISLLFSKNVYINLPTFAQSDFEQAGKCIAFGVPTAAAFHLVRGLEAYLKYFYQEITGEVLIGRETWGQILNLFGNHEEIINQSNDLSYVLEKLDSVRVEYRNPTQHPDKFYDMDLAQDLLGVVIEIVNKMYFVLIEKNGAGED